jgi:tetratricopeptide (TPR) repeat protein
MSLGDTMQTSGENSVPSGRREVLVLATLLAITVAAFAGVTGLVLRFNSWQSKLAARRYERGQEALRAGQPARAAQEFRSALHFKPDDPAALFSLAESLIAENRLDEAEAYFLNIWDRQPQDATVNLELARLAARRHMLPQAFRYYHNAIYGIWEKNPVDSRIAARLELVNFLLQQNSDTQAESELIAMEPGLSPDAGLHVKVADLFMRIPDYRNAFREYVQALKISRNSQAAAAGAGESAFNLGEYRTAVLYLEAASARSRDDQHSRALLETARMVLDIDPFLRHLSGLDRRDRILKAYRLAVKRLDQCIKSRGESTPPATPRTPGAVYPDQVLQGLITRSRQLKSQMTAGTLMKNPELPSAAMDFVFDVEEQSKQICGDPTGMDEALLLISRNREGVER